MKRKSVFKRPSRLSCCFDALQELSDLYGRLNEAKEQITRCQSDQTHCLAKSEAAAQSAAVATAEVIALKQELAEVSARARAMEADLASAQQVSCVACRGACASGAADCFQAKFNSFSSSRMKMLL